MRILVVAPTPFFSDRGTHIRILEEALALEKLGHDITIATYHIGKDIRRELDTKIDVRRILKLLFWYKKTEAGPDWQKIILDMMLIRKTFFLARTKRPDIIHGHLHEGILIGWIVQKLLFWRKIKLVADFHGSLTKEMLSHGYLKRGLKGVFGIVEKIINKLGDFAITSSWEMSEEIKKSRHDGKIETILDGTNLDSFNLKKTKEEAREEYEIPAHKFVVGYTGSLVSNKGINYFLESIPAVLKENRNVFFVIGGFPAEHAEKFIKENNLSKNDVRLISPLDYFKLPELLACCDAVVDPKDSSVAQASGKILNYMAAGLPIVCFDKINNRKYLGEGGYYCKEVGSEAIAQGIFYFFENENERTKKGELNKKNAKNFSWDIPAHKINLIYNKIRPVK
ncbi:MAG TPA: glycosyltransferase family 4 protein [Candidatus Moranbacteria bacterium]|nr:glycosyltransferase family 4 protein [Candidatus Moranbacteria bacterium]